MKASDILNIIQEHSLTVRCLPKLVISYYTYREGDEEKVKQPVYTGGYTGKPVLQTNVTKSVVYSESWKRKMIKEERIPEKGGWWYIKETANTSSTVRFDRKYDKFFAPTLPEAIQLYLNSKNIT